MDSLDDETTTAESAKDRRPFLCLISGPYSQGLCIGSADIAFDALVAKCADNECMPFMYP